LAALELPKKLAITVIAIRKVGSQAVVLPNPKEQLERGDILIVVARPGAVDKFLNRNE
jgi:Trk K+ transport system NAD-binding subunit